MVGLKSLIAVVVVLVSVSLLGQHVGAEVHHMVGDERGWDPDTNLTSWSSGRLFRVGDIIWFTYAAAQESVVELESIGEFSSCDLENPIKMYTEGLDKVQLDGEGSRYFASGNVESCKKGLKMHVNVHPKEKNETGHKDEPSSEGQDVPPEEKHDTHPDGPSKGGKDVPPEEKDDTRPDGPPHPLPPPGPPHSRDKDVPPPAPPHSKDKDVPPPAPPHSKDKDVPPPGPPIPSASTHLGGLPFLLLSSLLLCYLGF